MNRLNSKELEDLIKISNNSELSADERIKACNKIIKISHQSNDKNLEAETFQQKGKIYFSRNDFTNAINCFEKAISIYPISESEKIATLHNNIGLCLMKLHNFNKPSSERY